LYVSSAIWCAGTIMASVEMPNRRHTKQVAIDLLSPMGEDAMPLGIKFSTECLTFQ
jgi:hypothetical protein